MMTEKQEASFWDKTIPEPNTGCILWTSSLSNMGYGLYTVRVQDQTKTRLAHRVAMRLHLGRSIDGFCVLHQCDNPPCVNPRHLKLGGQSENLQEAVRRGRHPKANQTHCKRGHEFNAVNTRVMSKGHRRCRRCHADSEQRRREALR